MWIGVCVCYDLFCDHVPHGPPAADVHGPTPSRHGAPAAPEEEAPAGDGADGEVAAAHEARERTYPV